MNAEQPPYLVDPEVLRLVNRFSDDRWINFTQRWELAKVIQDAVEDWYNALDCEDIAREAREEK